MTVAHTFYIAVDTQGGYHTLKRLKHTFYVQLRFFENRAVYEIMWKKNVAERGRPQMTSLHAGYLRLQIHTQVV
jgi:hypothetical protein